MYIYAYIHTYIHTCIFIYITSLPAHRRTASALRRTGTAAACYLRSLLSEGGGSSCGHLWCCSCHVFVCVSCFSIYFPTFLP